LAELAHPQHATSHGLRPRLVSCLPQCMQDLRSFFSPRPSRGLPSYVPDRQEHYSTRRPTHIILHPPPAPVFILLLLKTFLFLPACHAADVVSSRAKPFNSRRSASWVRLTTPDGGFRCNHIRDCLTFHASPSPLVFRYSPLVFIPFLFTLPRPLDSPNPPPLFCPTRETAPHPDDPNALLLL